MIEPAVLPKPYGKVAKHRTHGSIRHRVSFNVVCVVHGIAWHPWAGEEEQSRAVVSYEDLCRVTVQLQCFIALLGKLHARRLVQTLIAAQAEECECVRRRGSRPTNTTPGRDTRSRSYHIRAIAIF